MDMSRPQADGSQRKFLASELRYERRAEQIAAVLRERVLTGDLVEGDLLPKESDLREIFPVSKPTLREALRILEVEGLLTVQRGNVGGALIHEPSPNAVAYSMALVLASRRVSLDDVVSALGELEPSGAALCAQREDRHTAVLPELRAVHESALEVVDQDVTLLVQRNQLFHSKLIELSGSETLATVAAAAEAVWSSHIHNYRSEEPITEMHLENRHRAIQRHAEIIDLIADGNAEEVRRQTALHHRFVRDYMLKFTVGPINATAVRDFLHSAQNQEGSDTPRSAPVEPRA